MNRLWKCVCVCEAFHGLNGVLLCGILVTVTSDLSFNRLICRSINYHLIDYIRRCRVIFHSVKGSRYTSRERERHFNDSAIRKSIETEETERRVIKRHAHYFCSTIHLRSNHLYTSQSQFIKIPRRKWAALSRTHEANTHSYRACVSRNKTQLILRKVIWI